MKKWILIICLVVELTFAGLIGMGSCILRKAEVKAWEAWHEKPSMETKAEFDRQKRITLFHNIIFSGVIFCGMAIVSVPIIHFAFGRRKN